MLFLGRRRRRKEAKGGPTANWKGGRGFTAVGRGMKKSPEIKAKILQLQSRERTKMKERKEYFFVVGFHKDVFLVESIAGQR